VNAAPVSSTDPYVTLPIPTGFMTLVGPSATARVHLVVTPSATLPLVAAALSTAASRVPVAAQGTFPGAALVARLGARMTSSSDSFLAAFPGAAVLNPPADVVSALAACGVRTTLDAADGSFTLNDVQFGSDDNAWLAELATICTVAADDNDDEAQLVAVGAFAAAAAAARYGAESVQATTLIQATDNVLARYVKAVLEKEPRAKLVFYATAALVPEPVSTAKVPVRDPNAVQDLMPAAENTATAQILIWVTVVLILAMFSTIVATFGVGVEGEKDTLLYRATTTFH